LNISTFVFLGGAALLIGYLVVIYNNLVALKHRVAKVWANIDVLLKQRHDELPKLVETCKEYMDHERETLEGVIAARNSVATARATQDIKALGNAESMLRGGLGKLFALAEQYPDLKANESFQHLQDRISQLENAIADRRELYNEAVNLNNTRIEQFPDVIIASRFNFKAHVLLEFSEAEISDVNIKSLFNS
jgi:LemA protein